MDSTKILITGHSVGNDLDLCQSCGFDYEWLFRYPSTLLWADKILITKSTWGFITDAGTEKESPFLESSKLVFNLLKDANVIEIFDPSAFIDEKTRQGIRQVAEADVAKMVKHVPALVRYGDSKNVPGEFYIQDHGYCSPYIYSVYASLTIAQILGAQCLFDKRALHFCNMRFGVNRLEQASGIGHLECFQSVLNSLFPNEPLLPEYTMFSSVKEGATLCSNCSKEDKCSSTYLETTERQMMRLLEFRDREELDASRNLIKKIIAANNDHNISADEIRAQFLSECRKLSKRNRTIFRDVKHWCSLSMMVSIPMTVIGLVSANPAITAAGAATLTASTAVRNYIDSMQEKYRWTAMINRGNKTKEGFFIKPT